MPPLATVPSVALFTVTVASEHTIGLGTVMFLVAPLATAFVLMTVPSKYLTTAEPSGATRFWSVTLGTDA